MKTSIDFDFEKSVTAAAELKDSTTYIHNMSSRNYIIFLLSFIVISSSSSSHYYYYPFITLQLLPTSFC